MTKEQENKEREEFEKMYCAFYFSDPEVPTITKPQMQKLSDYILSRIKAREEELKMEIEELGHQQEDDTIWCKMDDILALLTKEQEMRLDQPSLNVGK